MIRLICLAAYLLISFIEDAIASAFPQGLWKPTTSPQRRLPSRVDGIVRYTSTSIHAYPTHDSRFKKQFRSQGGMFYKTSVLSKEELRIINSEMAHLRLRDETSLSAGRKRVGAIVPRESITVRILQEGSIFKLLQDVMGKAYHLSKDIPVELRVYEKEGAGMDWHVDDVLYDPTPQIEIIVTLDNTSDCRTMLRIPGSGDLAKTVALETQASSSLLILAGGIPHCVSSLKRGKRVILKCAYNEDSSSFRQNAMVPQFGKTRLKKGKN